MSDPIDAINARLRDPAVQQEYRQELTELARLVATRNFWVYQAMVDLATRAGFTDDLAFSHFRTECIIMQREAK